MPVRVSMPHFWIRFLLAYLIFAGFVPFLSELRTLIGGRASNPYHNFELAWGLMHIFAALAGIGVSLWYLRHSSIFATGAVVLLTLQVLFPILEYRREGFDPRMSVEWDWPGYLTTMLALALPFAFLCYLVIRKRRPSH
ncbi:MAG: hypothetical protein EOP84_25975 [Verrucomicrobiaceae bacterium]|nr:MAG: hypothetical protein EOP84_25975 [Verrucomicrobiaceae bacterium]